MTENYYTVLIPQLLYTIALYRSIILLLYYQWRRLCGARGHVPPLLATAGHGNHRL